MKKVLVSYFSASGNTKSVAEKIATAVNGDLFEIEPKDKYTDKDSWIEQNVNKKGGDLVAEEEDTDEDHQQGGQHAGAAIGHELLRAQGKHEAWDTCDESEAPEQHRHGEEGCRRVHETHYAGGDEQDAGND